ncbi:hypothetical protein [Streptomyces omiyaensis]|uniref:Secreted protein n=1 Tax=Streptomyces omiyaensis TaxID=68247 RepID=A0ABW7C0I6_9ACTN|nr:hypothetical protein [Streptomyces omiyaensis]GGY80410.1 hypothetical protein GCM10010363_71620 [Streptomyces omiyaensis]
MNNPLKSRAVTLSAVGALLAGASLTVGAGDAAAASFTFEKSSVSSDGSFSIAAYYNGTYAGAMVWNADPGCCGIPGDAFQVVDRLSEGWGMEAYMITPVTGRKATTRGHSAVYYSPWTTGDLEEGTTVSIQLCAVKGDYEECSIAYTGHA